MIYVLGGLLALLFILRRFAPKRYVVYAGPDEVE